MKKIYLIVGIILVIGAVFVALFFRGVSEIQPNKPGAGGLPFGSGDGVQIDEETNEKITEEVTNDLFTDAGVPTKAIFPITDKPTAGGVIFARGTRSVVRYVERSTGHIYEVGLPQIENEALEPIKLSNNTMPKVYEALFRNDGGAVLVRSIDNNADVVSNILLTITASSTAKVSAANLRGDVRATAIGSGNTLYFSDISTNTISSTDFNGGAVRTLLNSPFIDWQLSSSGGTPVVFPKPSFNVPGSLYTLGANGVLNKILGPFDALSALPDTSATWIFYTHKEGQFSKSGAINTRTKLSVPISPATFPEKCVWNNKKTGQIICAVPIDPIGSEEPDRWYKGITSFSDRIWSFDVNTEIAEIVLEPREEFGLYLDIINPKISADGKYLIFTNKRDMSLWAVRLEAL